MSIEATEQGTPTTPETKNLNMENRELFEEMTPRMILADLGEGLTRDEIAAKYKYVDPTSGEEEPLTRAQVDMMFKDPALKNKRPAKKRKKLPFAFAATKEEEVIPETPSPEANTAAPTTDGDPTEAAEPSNETEINL